ncbi:MAG: ADP-ribosylglycohydrolase family protein [Pseudomonadota bacterium]
MSLPADYVERVYAGMLGKTIGVYLGRPFEGWTYERIQQRLGDITHYVNEELGQPLIVTDDDISGTFTFLRALADNNYKPTLTASDIGDAWLNYLIEERTILWWGGMGNSTEHTAYLRLKSGMQAPESGSAATNGKVVAEQIGAQIFIDGWAMITPGDPERAAYFAEQAARVSHDGEAVYGAIVLATMESAAFVEPDTNRLLDLALGFIPADCVIRRLIDDVRGWHAAEPDWRVTRQHIADHYGYDKYGGNCHMVPNHGLIVHALLHGQDNFSETMKIINTSGWDTDCNAGNLGCLIGIKNGLAGIDASQHDGFDWREPVADRIYIPTADPTWGISDCAREAIGIANAGRALRALPPLRPKGGAQFHFALPGAVQGFRLTAGNGSLANQTVVEGERRVLQLASAGHAEFGSPVFAPSKAVAKQFEGAGYALLASPRIYAGQVLSASVSSADGVSACLYLRFYGEDDQEETLYGEMVTVSGDARLTLAIPTEIHPVFEVGLAVTSKGSVDLDSIRWDGEPHLELGRPLHRGTMWRRAWVNGVDRFDSWGEAYRLIQNTGRGLLIQGTREWRNYTLAADVTPHLAKAAGIAARVQGMRRYYALLLHQDAGQGPELRLIRMLTTETVLARCPFNWSFGETCQLALRVSGESLVASVDGKVLLEATDGTLDCGSVALVIEEGRTATNLVSLSPV